MVYTYHYESPLGGMTMSSDGESLTGLWFDGQKYFAVTVPENHEEKSLPVFDKTAEWLDIYFDGREPDFTLPLKINTTPFRKRVCEIMLTIPYGQTMTYGDIAKIIATEQGKKTMSRQAVGGGVGHNPISIIVPCHRVVGTNGSLTGYAGGIDRKIGLMKLENIDMSAFYTPEKGTAL